MLLFFNDTSKEVQEMLKTAHADTLKRQRFQACKYIDLSTTSGITTVNIQSTLPGNQDTSKYSSVR